MAIQLVGLMLLGCASAAQAAIAIDQITDINGDAAGFGGPVTIFASGAGAPFQVDDTGVFMNNDIVVYTMDGLSANDGAGLVIRLSNGENGITSTEGGANTDINNTVPADTVFTTIGNGSGKLENGNVIRFSMWMRQDPNNPVVKQPQVEPVVKIELWKEALSGNADFSGAAFPGFGDRVWDTDQNASNPLHVAAGQSQASWVDMNNNGAIANGQPVAASLVTDEWRLVETTLIVDDDPLDDSLGWSIGAEFFDVADIEEVRAVMFVGDFAGTDLNDGGSFWVDNLLLEVFANEADMLATPNPNTAPIEMAGVQGDYNNDGVVNAADYVLWRNGGPLENEVETPGTVTQEDYDFWVAQFGSTGGGGGTSAVIPEPATWIIVNSVLLAWAFSRRRLRS
jgi:hypothetical protein